MRRRKARQVEDNYNLTKPQVVDITRKTIDKEIEQAKKETLDYAVRVSAAVFLMSVNQLYGFGSKRLIRIMEKFNQTFECINAGTVDVNDFIQHCSEEFGIEVYTKPKK